MNLINKIDKNDIFIKIEKKDVFFLNSVFESTERYAIFRTIDAKKGVAQLICSPDFIEDVNKIIIHLKKYISIEKIGVDYLKEYSIDMEKLV